MTLGEICDAWNARERARVAAEDAAKAAKKAARMADPKYQAQAERARRYRETHKKELAQKARERRTRERAAYYAARQAFLNGGLDIFS